jgi:hypothetical protein
MRSEIKRREIMKNKDFESVTNILEDKNPNKKFYNFMDFGDCQSRIDEDIIPKVEIVELPKIYFKRLIKFIKAK